MPIPLRAKFRATLLGLLLAEIDSAIPLLGQYPQDLERPQRDQEIPKFPGPLGTEFLQRLDQLLTTDVFTFTASLSSLFARSPLATDQQLLALLPLLWRYYENPNERGRQLTLLRLPPRIQDQAELLSEVLAYLWGQSAPPLKLGSLLRSFLAERLSSYPLTAPTQCPPQITALGSCLPQFNQMKAAESPLPTAGLAISLESFSCSPESYGLAVQAARLAGGSPAAMLTGLWVAAAGGLQSLSLNQLAPLAVDYAALWQQSDRLFIQWAGILVSGDGLDLWTVDPLGPIS